MQSICLPRFAHFQTQLKTRSTFYRYKLIKRKGISEMIIILDVVNLIPANFLNMLLSAERSLRLCLDGKHFLKNYIHVKSDCGMVSR